MDDLISRQAAIIGKMTAVISDQAIEVIPVSHIQGLSPAQPERKTGRWINKGVISDGGVIEEWQECQCSECKRWDTRPYMYYFDEPNYCSYCGAKRQKGGANEMR